jgi:hypothetical protein
VKRPTIDTSAHYKRVRPRDVQPDDAITFDPPAPGVRYYRITEVKPGKIGGTKVYGYFVGTKKAEDSGRVSEQIKFVGGRGYLIERSGEKPEAKPTRTPTTKERVANDAPPKTAQTGDVVPECPALQPGDVMVNRVLRQGRVNLTVVRPGKPILQARDDHYNWTKIEAALNSGDTANLDELFNVPKSIEIKFKRLSERVTVRHGRIHLDNDPVDNALTKQVLKYLDEERDDWGPLVKFFEKVQANPSDNSRAQLFTFLDAHDLELTDDGDLITYKKVRTDFKSDHAGHGFSDGVEYKSANIPNNIGSIVEMPRSEVRDDPHQDCSVGLHVATLNFAKLVVNPRDVVSVPHRDAAKVRVCRYRVLEEVSTTA